MKTKDLIAELQKEDPSGEAECCVDNVDIYFVEAQGAYYDGRLEVLQRDANGRVVGGKITGKGQKVKIRTLSIEEMLYDQPDAPVVLDTGNPQSDAAYQDRVDVWRAEAKKLKTQVEIEGEYFRKYGLWPHTKVSVETCKHEAATERALEAKKCGDECKPGAPCEQICQHCGGSIHAEWC